MKIQSIQYENYKAFKIFSVKLENFNIFVGPNNSGKSTIIQSIQLLHAAWNSKKRRRTEYIPELDMFGYRIQESTLPIGIDNVHNEYKEVTSKIRFKFEGSGYAVLTFPPDIACFLHFEDSNHINLENSITIRNRFKFNIGVVPFLGPIDPTEILLSKEHVLKSFNTYLSPRHFRNQWYHDDSNFKEFTEFLNETWPEMSIQLPQRHLNELVMFCSEKHIDREISWAGCGFQVWMQILTHLVKNKNATTIIFDEPEIYLHPDLQRKFISVAKQMPYQVILATHSVEIINEAEVNNINIIDKNLRSSERLEDSRAIQKVVDYLGSVQNMHLTRLLRNKKILFLEGKDFLIIKKIAYKLGFQDLSNELGITIVPIGGFSNWPIVQHAELLFTTILEEDIECTIILDRDYRCDEEIKELIDRIQKYVNFIHVWNRKEIENYLLDIYAIKKVSEMKIRRRKREDLLCKVSEEVDNAIKSVINENTEMVVSNYQASKLKYRGAKHVEVINRECSEEIRKKMEIIVDALSLISGKKAVIDLNTILQKSLGVSFTYNEIIRAIDKDSFPEEINEVLKKIEAFRIRED